MLARCRALLTAVTHSSLKYATFELNDRLDLSGGRRPVPRDELKGFLSRNVQPILEGTSLDRRDNTSEMRHWLGQLLRDASFSAHVVKAKPTGRFVQTITDCIRQDATRMNFIPKMTSAQASKTIEHLCSIGVRDSAVFTVLLTRIDFTNLREVARVMFAFTEANLSAYNVNLFIPLYCGETFSLTVTYRPGAPRREENAYCNLLDAIRVLRAISKSIRSTVEASRADKGKMTVLPYSSVNQLRNALVLFVMEHAEDPFLRGAHWSNFARAMMHFPVEFSELVGLAGHGGDPLQKQRLLVRTVEGLLAGEDATAPWRHADATIDLAREAVMCAELARYGLLRVFDRAEGRLKALPKTTASHSPAASSSPAGTKDGSDASARVFDLSSMDMIKLVRVVQEVYPSRSPLRRRRVSCVVDSLMHRVSDINFRGLMLLLQAMRTTHDDDVSRNVVETVVAEAGRRLRDAQLADDVPFPALVEFCSLLSVFRVQNCQEAVAYICDSLDTFPHALDGHSGLALLKALTVTRDGNLSARRTAGLDVAERLTFHYQRAGPLLTSEPVVCDKLWAALVLLDAVPTPVILDRCCGPAGSAPLAMNPQIRAAGSVLLFDISRSLFHFGKEASASVPAQLHDLWDAGIVRSLLPLLGGFSEMELRAAQHNNGAGGRALTNGYVPIAWRSTMEAVSLYLDKVAPDAAVRMLADVMEPLKALGSRAALWAVEQMKLTDASSETQRQRAFAQLSFSSNAVIHLLSFLLMFEHCVFRVGWKCRGKGDLGGLAMDLRADFLAYLQAPITADDGPTVSIMDVVTNILGDGSTRTAQTSLLQKRHALEITTNLPFAISLVLEAGPVNEHFTECTVPLMMAAIEDTDEP